MDRRQAPKARRSSLEAALGAIGGVRHGSHQVSRGSPMAIGAAARPPPFAAPASPRQSTAGIGDPDWMMSDYSTMPSHGNYFTNLLNQEFVDVSVSEDNVEAENELPESVLVNDTNSQPKPKGRSKNFSEKEDILLVSAYLNVSKDPITGRDQKDGRFWERIENYFHERKTFQSDRNWSSLRHRWGIIQKEVSVFQSYLDAIERKNESGKASKDKLAEAKATFHRLQKKVFSVFHAWNILRHEPKWATFRPPKLGNTIPESNNANEEDQPNTQRPPGRKAEKEKEKAKKRGEYESDPFIEEVKKMRESRQEIERDRKDRDDRFFELEKKKLDLEQDQQDKRIMETDTSAMDNESKQYFKLMKEEILARRFGSSQP